MYKIGITGGIGSGKSIVCKVFKKLGIPVYDADSRAKELYEIDTILKNQMIQLFGIDIYKSNTINKVLLSDIIFKDKEKLDEVNRIVPLAIERDFSNWCKSINSSLIVFEAAILLERGMQGLFDCVITVTAPVDLRIQRCLDRSAISTEEITQRMQAQWSDEEKIRQSHFIVINDNNHAILPQVLQIIEEINFTQTSTE